MNKSPTSRAGAAVLSAVGVLLLAVPHARAQQSGNVFPVANTTGAPGAAATPSTAGDPAPNVENAPPGKQDPNAPTETEILATKGANFESKDRVAVFEGDVRVNDPRFQLACDRLTVFLAKATPGDNSKGPDPARSPSGGGIDHASALGRVIIIQKRPPAKPGEEAKVSVGRAERADFDNRTGDMVLSGSPSIEQNGNLHESLSHGTTMILHRDNSMTTQGPSRTVIKGKGGATDLPGSAPSNPGQPGGQGDKKRRRDSAVTPG